MRQNRTLSGMTPGAQRMVSRLFAVAESVGINDLSIGEGHRSFGRQAELFAQGRTTPGDIVTKAKPGTSRHEKGEAVDLFFKSGKTQKERFDPAKYRKLANAYKELYGDEMVWGGDWKMRDMPHFQYNASKASNTPNAKGLVRNNITAGALEGSAEGYLVKLKTNPSNVSTTSQVASNNTPSSTPGRAPMTAAQAQQLESIEKIEGPAGEMPDRFSDMTFEQLMAENEEIRKSTHELFNKIQATPKKTKEKGWFG